MPDRVVGKMAGNGVPTATSGGAPSSTWTAGVGRMAPPPPNAPPMVPATNPEAIPRTTSRSTTSARRVQRVGRSADDVAFARVAGPFHRLGQREPPDLLHLAIVLGDVPPERSHQVERDLLPDPLAVPHEPIGDVAQRAQDLSLQPR